MKIYTYVELREKGFNNDSCVRNRLLHCMSKGDRLFVFVDPCSDSGARIVFWSANDDAPVLGKEDPRWGTLLGELDLESTKKLLCE